tara:strand:+ start:294 stop:1004 length:711 start_codon:yes stop_codon:yes gene_type:complete
VLCCCVTGAKLPKEIIYIYPVYDIYMKNIIFLTTLFFALNLYSQRIKVETYKATADSIIRAKVGNDLYNYFSYTTGYYTYPNPYGSFWSGSLNRRKLPNNFVEVRLLYHFNYLEIDGVKGGIWIILDKNLKLLEEPSFNFIPDFVKNGTSSNFITVAEASEFAKKYFLKKGFHVDAPILNFDEGSNIYVYTIIQKITATSASINRKTSGETEIITISAVDGSLINRKVGYYGISIR